MKKKKTGSALRHNRWGYFFLIPFFVVFIIFQLIPLITTIYNSFFEHYFKNGLTEIGPNFIGLENFKRLLASGDIMIYFKNTMIMWIMGFVPQIILSLLLAGMLGVDQSLYEAAEVDGASSTQIFFRITLPILRPILLYVVITSLIGGLQLFDVPQILTNGQGGPNRTTMTLIMYLNKHLYSKNYGMGGALSAILFFITGVLSIIVFRINTRSQQ